jgi:Phage integrase family.
MERLKILPTDYNQFIQLPIIQELIKQLRLKGDTERSIDRNVRAIYELCMFCAKHPDDLTIDDILNFIDYKRLEWMERGKDLRKQEVLSQFSTEYISPLRVWCKFKGLPIPPALTTVEYYSPYRKVRITVEQRYQLLKYIYEKYRDYYELVRATLIFLYETGSRAQALRNVQFLETEEFGQKVIYAITEEKGKRTQIRWEKPINPKWWSYIKGFLPIRSDNMLRRIKEILREAYEAVLPEGLTKRYALEHPFHVWRHTAANDLLEASNFNLMLVAQKLGWKNVQMIVNVYGTMDKAMLLRLSGYNIEYQVARFEFLYNEYYQRAKEEGLI